MALQGKFWQKSDFKDSGKLHKQAYFKVIKASIVAEDLEVLRPVEEEVSVVEYVTRYKGQGVVMVYADQLAYKNRAIPVGSFFVEFPADPLSTVTLICDSYKAIPATLGEDPKEYLTV